MYFKDMSQYSYYQSKPFEGVLNVGWLEREHSYSKGVSPLGFVEKLSHVMRLNDISSVHVNRIRSIHPCNLCGEYSFEEIDPMGNLLVGASEIWIPRLSGGFFAAPSMLIHYVDHHHYLPPKEFVDAVIAFDSTKPFNAQVEYDRRAAIAMT